MRFLLTCTDLLGDQCDYVAESLGELIECMKSNSQLESRTYPIYDADSFDGSEEARQHWPFNTPVVGYITRVGQTHFGHILSKK